MTTLNPRMPVACASKRTIRALWPRYTSAMIAALVVLLLAACSGAAATPGPQVFDAKASVASLRAAGWTANEAPGMPDTLSKFKQVGYLETTAPDGQQIDTQFMEDAPKAVAELAAVVAKSPHSRARPSAMSWWSSVLRWGLRPCQPPILMRCGHYSNDDPGSAEQAPRPAGNARRRCARALSSEHGGERACVEHNPQRPDLVTANLIPLGNERRTRRRVRDHVVEHADIRAVREHLLNVNFLDDIRQLFYGADIVIRLLKGVQWALERQIIMQHLPGGCEVTVTDCRLIRLNEFTDA